MLILLSRTLAYRAPTADRRTLDARSERGTKLDTDHKGVASPGLAGRYIIRRELGRGMMGVVYEAEDTLLGRTVALKTIELAFRVDEATYQHFEERFFTEARVAAKLSHPGIVVCHDVGKDPASGKLFIVFEYLKGLTLAERIVADTIAWEDALGIVTKVARAIHHAHVNDVIHRDLKPANVMLLDSGQAGLEASETAIKIMDFGVARLESLPVRLTRTGQSFGSPLYMSPEQVLGHAATARSDIFSLGSILCTLLLGRGWFEARSIPEVLARVVHDEAPAVSKLRPHLPGTLDDVVARALAKRPEDRYPTAAAVADDLEDVLAGLGPRHASALTSTPPTEPERDTLLADLVKDAGAGAPVDPTEALASLVDEVPAQAAAALTLPAWEVVEKEAPPAGRRLGRPSRVAVAGAAAVVLVAGAFLLWRGASSAVRSAAPSPPAATARWPEASTAPDAFATAETNAVAEVGAVAAVGAAAEIGATSDRGAAPEAGTRSETGVMAETPAVTPPPAATPAPRRQAPPTSRPAPAGERSAAASPQARLRLLVEHPFESGRLIVWIDGVLVYETKLQASVSRRIIGVRVREGQLEKLLEVRPGRHEVRVEVSWSDQHRVETQLVDVAPDSTGLLEVRVARLTRSLSLEWSRLAD